MKKKRWRHQKPKIRERYERTVLKKTRPSKEELKAEALSSEIIPKGGWVENQEPRSLVIQMERSPGVEAGERKEDFPTGLYAGGLKEVKI